ncbi:MAG: ethanolamine utilization protein EutJ [Deltaproteobacteria bacterium]|jgi:ethanolamine utilization protein EutJ
MNPDLNELLGRTEAVMDYGRGKVGGRSSNYNPTGSLSRRKSGAGGRKSVVHVGVDLGTAYTVLIVLDENLQPLAGESRFAQIVRDGLIVDFHGAIRLVQELKEKVELRLGFELETAATGYPPGVSLTEVRATQHVIESAGMECDKTVDEPTAANAVLQIENGAVVDVGGGTTGVAVFRNGERIYTADEPTGGTHFSLVIAGALDKSFEEAEDFKKDKRNHKQLFPVVRPVMEKMATIVARHVEHYPVDAIYLVGGTACFSGIEQVFQQVLDIPTFIPSLPLLVTPLGIAMHDKS